MDDGDEDVGLAILRGVLGCPIAVMRDPARDLRDFEASYSFIPERQPALKATWLVDYLERADRTCVHELSEPLGTMVTLFWLEGRLVVIGPYTSHALHPGEAEALLGGLRIASAHLQAFTIYRARFPIVDTEYVMRGATSLMQMRGQDPSRVTVTHVATAAAPVGPGAGEPTHSASFEAIERRYAAEQEFMLAVAAGEERRALDALQHMTGGGVQPPAYLTTPYLGPTILRIMTRVAAQQSGLPAVTIDAISQTYAQQLHRSSHVTDPRRATPAITAMVQEFCLHVRRYHQRPYSRLVRQVMDEIDLHLSQHISPRDLAARLGLSESHLARQFKTETGRTISQHVAVERIALASRLLATTTQPVQDIAAYVGYSDANYFVKVFKSVSGVTPTAYRVRNAR